MRVMRIKAPQKGISSISYALCEMMLPRFSNSPRFNTWTIQVLVFNGLTRKFPFQRADNAMVTPVQKVIKREPRIQGKLNELRDS